MATKPKPAVKPSTIDVPCVMTGTIAQVDAFIAAMERPHA